MVSLMRSPGCSCRDIKDIIRNQELIFEYRYIRMTIRIYIYIEIEHLFSQDTLTRRAAERHPESLARLVEINPKPLVHWLTTLPAELPERPTGRDVMDPTIWKILFPRGKQYRAWENDY